jgi:hypothetical protein
MGWIVSDFGFLFIFLNVKKGQPEGCPKLHLCE